MKRRCGEGRRAGGRLRSGADGRESRAAGAPRRLPGAVDAAPRRRVSPRRASAAFISVVVLWPPWLGRRLPQVPPPLTRVPLPRSGGAPGRRR